MVKIEFKSFLSRAPLHCRRLLASCIIKLFAKTNRLSIRGTRSCTSAAPLRRRCEHFILLVCECVDLYLLLIGQVRIVVLGVIPCLVVHP